jgi:hyperosmotically inducible protein
MQTRNLQQIISIGLCILLIGALATCSKGPDDATVAANVKSKLMVGNSSSASEINVEAKNGVVTLNGTVDSDASKSLAEQNAKGVAGVKSVMNNLTVKPQAAAPPLTFAGDTALKNTVEANLAKYGVTGITVTVADGEVTLTGDIVRAKLQDAMKAANGAQPKKVKNEMNIK